MSSKKLQDKSSSRTKSTTKQQVKKRKMKKKNWLWVWLSLTGVAMLSATAGAMFAVLFSGASPLQQAKLSPEEKAVFGTQETVSEGNLQIPQLNRPVNILVLGVKVLTSDIKDKPKDAPELGYHALVNSFDGLADTMLLLRFDPNNKKVTAVSIPRDTRAEIEGHGATKINAANDLGGPALAAQTVSNLLQGVPIDRYIRVNVQGVEKLIDALGGVTVYVPKDMKYQDDSQHLYINLKKGLQHLDGNKALQFLRYRYDTYGDISRIQRQQTLMRAVVEQAVQPSIVVKVPQILSVIQSHLDTNLSLKEIIAVTGFATQTQKSDVQMVMLPGAFSGDGKTLETSYWMPSESQIQSLVAQHFGQGYSEAQTTDPSYLNIAIQDSTGDPEAVKAMVRSLREAGYRNVYVADNYRQPLSVTKIVAQKGDDGSASAIRATLGIGNVVVESTGILTSDITIQLGEDWRQNANARVQQPVSF